MHPSELPGSFERAVLPPPRRVGSRRLQAAIATSASALLIVGGLLLASPDATRQAGASTGPYVMTSIHQLPAADRLAASSMLALVIFEGQHLGAATAMVMAPGDIAVTTTPIPLGATVMGRAYGHSSMQLQVIGTDRLLGVTVLRLPVTVPVTPIAPISAGLSTGGAPTTLVTLAAVRGATVPVQFEYAPAYLSSQPTAATLGRSVLAVTRGQSQSGTIAGTIVLDGQGAAIAADVPSLTSTSRVRLGAGTTDFLPASFLAQLAQRMVLGDVAGHGWLQLEGQTDRFGAVKVSAVDYSSASYGKVQVGDTITAIDSIPVRSMADIGSFLYASSPGLPVDLTLIRDGRTINAIVVLAASP